MKKTAIFDLDGTLLYTLEDLTDSTNYALQKFNYQPCTISQVRSYVGNGVYKLIERALPEGDKNSDFQKCLEVFKNHYKENMYNKTCPFEGVLDMLSELKKRNINVAVVSNKFDAAVKELCSKYFANLVDIAVGESPNVRKKPAPDSVFAVMKHFKTKPIDCVYIGDSEVDIETAKNAGIDCISVNWGYKDTEFLIKNNAQTIVSSCDELLKQILKQH